MASKAFCVYLFLLTTNIVELHTAELATPIGKQINEIANGIAALSPLVESLSDAVIKKSGESMESRFRVIELAINGLSKEIQALRAVQKSHEESHESCHEHPVNLTQIPYVGTAGADSEWSHPGGVRRHKAIYAFQPQTSNPPWANNNGLPSTVWYKFKSPQTVSKLSITSRKNENYASSQAPKSFVIVASDDCQSWMELLYWNDAGFTAASKTKTFTIPCYRRGSYLCYGIRTLESRGSKVTVSMVDVKMYN